MRTFRRPRIRLATAVAGLALTAMSAHALDNAGFETPDQGAGGFAYTPAGAGWTFSASAGVSGPNGPWKCNDTSPDPNGDQFGYLQRDASISQDMTNLIVGATYEINFFESYRSSKAASNDLSVIVDEGLAGETTIYNNADVNNRSWEPRTTSQFVATAGTQSLTLRSTNPLGTDDRTTIIDGVVVTLASLPGTPVIDTLSPADDATAVPTFATLSVTFDRPIKAGTGNITLKDTDTMSDTVIPIGDAQVSIDYDTVTITPTNLLSPLTNYAVTIDSGAVQNEDGATVFGGIADDGSWTFITDSADTVAPTISTLSPADGTHGVAITTGLAISFDETVVKGTGNIVIKRSSDGTLVDTIDVTTGSVTVTGADVAISPNVSLDPGRGHYVEIDAGAFKDVSGNDFAGITGGSGWNFLTNAIYYVPITGDADSGIDSAKTYTHAIDFGNNGAFPVAVINGVTFAGAGAGPFPADPAASHTVGAGNSSVPNSHGGNGTANAFLVDGGMEALVGDMIYNNTAAVITLTGLTPGQPYSFRLYHRPWGIGGTRQQTIAFDTDGVAGAEATAAFDEDNAMLLDPAFATDTQVNALAFDYSLPAGQTTLTVNINNTAGGSYHLYGLTNEETTDSVAPELIAVDPANGTVDLLTYANLSATFTETIALGTGSVTLKNTTDATETVLTLPDPQVSAVGSSLVINPDTNLLGNKDFAVVVGAGVVTDPSGNPFGGIADDGSWTFTTGVGDLVAPSVASLSPADDATDASRILDLVITLSEDVQKGSGDIVVKLASDDSVVETFDVNSAAVVVNGTEVSISLSTFLELGTAYYVEIAATAFQDAYGNTYAGIADATTWNFTTTSLFNDITFVPITGDADSGIDGSKTYTHALDFGNGSPGALVNGLQFDAYGAGANGTLNFNRTAETGNLQSHPGNGTHNVSGDLVTLMTDMYYNGGNAPGGATSWILSGLSGGVEYDLRIYTRQWGPNQDRNVTFIFDPDGAGPLADPSVLVSQDDATLVGFAADNQAYYINYRFTAVEGEDLVITAIQDNPNYSWHLYGITNEVVGSGSDYLGWASNYTGDLSDPNADLDGDGLSNDAERLFGLDPSDPSSVNPILVPLDPASGTLSFTRRTQALTGMSYSVWTSTDLQAWSQDTGASLTPGTPVDEVETVAVTLAATPVDGRLFVQIRAGLLFSEDFEADNGGFTTENKGTGTGIEWGTPDTLGLGGGDVTAGNGGSLRCWGTNLIGPYAADTDVCLRSRVIDLSGVTAATLSFAGAIDAASGHTFEVNLIEAATDTLIANLVPATGDSDETVAPWEQVGPVPLPAAAFTQAFRIEWRFTGNGDNGYGGVYLDDVVIMETLP